MSKTAYRHKPSPARRRALLKRSVPLYIMALPGLVYLIVNNYIPIPGLILAFKKYNYTLGIFGSPWAGLTNFRFLFGSREIVNTLRNTLCYNLAFFVVNNLFAVMAAVILSGMRRRAGKLYQSVILFPLVLSAVVTAEIVYTFLATETGLVNTILRLAGMGSLRFYATPRYWWFILILVNLWKNVGFNCVIYLAVILGIDRSITEAAALDGADGHRQFFHITLPQLRPTITLLALIAFGRILNSDLGLFYHVPMNSGMLYSTTSTVDTYILRAFFNTNNIPVASATGLLQSFAGFILMLTAYLIIRRIDPENPVF